MLSQNDFQALQLQLFNLKESNYSLDQKCKKLQNENNNLKQHNENLDKELQKANKILQKCKNSKEVETLLLENENLQAKLHSHEEDFRLQNTTLMNELATIIRTNEQLENEVKKLKTNKTFSNYDSNNIPNEIISLKAENNALKSQLKESQKKVYDLEDQRQKLENYCKRLKGERGSPLGSSSQSTNDIAFDINEVSNIADSIEERPMTLGSEFAECNQINESNFTNDRIIIDQLNVELNELKLKLNTNEEEKRLLNEDFSKKINEFNENCEKFKIDIEACNEKYNKKCEVYKQIQIDKDILIEKNSKLEDEKKTLILKCTQYEAHAALLESQIGSVSAENNQRLRECTEQFEIKIQQLNNQIATIIQEKENISVQLEDSQKAYMNILEEMQKIESEQEGRMKTIDEMTKLADKRKQMLDEMAIKMQNENLGYNNELKQMKQKYEDKYKDYERKIDELQEIIKDFRLLADKCNNQEQQLKANELTKQNLEKQIKDFETQINNIQEENEKLFKDKCNSYENEFNEMNKKFESQKEIYEVRNSELSKQCVELRSQIEKLNQDMKDENENKKIYEKKYVSTIKDLKRQLNLEKKRADKLQEKLSDLLSNCDVKVNFDDMNDYESRKSNSIVNCDSSSISSFNQNNLEGTLTSGNGKSLSPTLSSKHQHETDYRQLLDKITELQELNWRLEEKVNHLETANAAMAEDLMTKSSVIAYYSLDKKYANNNTHTTTASNSQSNSIGSNLKSIMAEFINTKSILQNTNTHCNESDDVKKLQRLLEETLTKNMHLEQDMEKLTKEIQKLKSR